MFSILVTPYGSCGKRDYYWTRENGRRFLTTDRNEAVQTLTHLRQLGMVANIVTE